MYIVSCVCLVNKHYLNQFIILFLCTIFFSAVVPHVCLVFFFFFTFSTLIQFSVPPANKSIENICSKNETILIEAGGTVSKRTLLESYRTCTT